MVTFTRIPYAEAARRSRVQDRVVYGVLLLLGLTVLSLLMLLLLLCRADR
jgi:hypothetical protein